LYFLHGFAILYEAVFDFQRRKNRMIYLYECGPVPDEKSLQVAAWQLPDEMRLEFARTKRPEQLYQRLSAWMLLGQAVAQEYGIGSLAELQIARSARGKPYSRAYPGLFFNLSHCAAACACIVSGQRVGVDVEQLFPYREALAKRVCHREEWEYLQELADAGDADQSYEVDSGGHDSKHLRFLHILWSAKESIVKMDGSGLGYGLDRLNLMPLFAGKTDEGLQEPDTVRQYQGVIEGIGAIQLLVKTGRNYTLAACMEADERQKQKMIIINKEIIL
jgi:phosphopantetheinyl transferase